MNSHQNDPDKRPDEDPPKLLDCLKIIAKAHDTLPHAIQLLEGNAGTDAGLQGIHHGLGRIARYLRFLQTFPPFITANLAREESREAPTLHARRASTPDTATIQALMRALMRALVTARRRMLQYGENPEEIREIEDAVLAGAVALNGHMDANSAGSEVMPRAICMLFDWHYEKLLFRDWISVHSVLTESTTITMGENVPNFDGTGVFGRFVAQAVISKHDLETVKYPDSFICCKIQHAIDTIAADIAKPAESPK